MIFVLIGFFLLIPLIIIAGLSWMIKDYSEEEKKEVWENFYNGLNK
jgi:hypothetical protein